MEVGLGLDREGKGEVETGKERQKDQEKTETNNDLSGILELHCEEFIQCIALNKH
jgi:hypothetical protein